MSEGLRITLNIAKLIYAMHNLQISKPRYFISSLSKGLSVLQAFAEVGHPLTLSEIANALKANHTTATRLCYTLTELGFIQKDGQRGSYEA